MDNLYDVVVIGGGPAGLTAAIYLARAKYRVLVVEEENFGGQITITSEVVNYPGISNTSGTDLTDTMKSQAKYFGAEFLLAKAKKLELENAIKVVYTSAEGKNEKVSCFGVLIATGAHPRMIGFKGEEKFRGRGVAYCATCDGEFFTGKEVFVVGGGFAAAEESVFLTKYANHVTILIREDDFTCAKATADAARNHEKITVLTNVEVEEVGGETFLEYLHYKNNKTGEITKYHAKEGDTFGVFVFAGYEPATSLVRGIIKLNSQGYIETDKSQKTSIEGVYAAGDICEKPLRQVVTAVGDGALAATELERYAASMQKKTGLYPKMPTTADANTNGTVNGNINTSANTAVNSNINANESADNARADVINKTSNKISNQISESMNRKNQENQEIFDEDMLSQLYSMFGRMQKLLVLKLYLDNRPISVELREYMQQLAALTDKISVKISESIKNEKEKDALPYVSIEYEDGSKTGLSFHGVPGGHEFTSFLLGLYNASGPGQAIDEQVKQKIKNIAKPVDIKVLVSLSCTMCPDLVIAVQKIAAENALVTAAIYDVNHFEKLRNQYKVMSVPCLIIDDTKVSFGKKNINQVLEML